MLTIQDTVNEINRLQPDLTDMWNVKPEKVATELEKLIQQPISAINLFKIELLTIYGRQHVSGDVYVSMLQRIQRFLSSNNLQSYSAELIKIPHCVVPKIKDAIANKQLIIGQVTNPKQYLNAYLKSKLTSGTTAINYDLKPDLFSLTVFESSLQEMKKPLNSVQAITFLTKVINFEQEIKYKYLDIVMAHCPEQSIKLKELLMNGFNSSTKYQSIHRWYISNMARNKITFGVLFDGQHSTYLPIVSNTSIPPLENKPRDYNSILGSALVLLQSDKFQTYTEYYEYLVKCINSSETLKSGAIQDLQQAQAAISKLLEDMTNGSI